MLGNKNIHFALKQHSTAQKLTHGQFSGACANGSTGSQNAWDSLHLVLGEKSSTSCSHWARKRSADQVVRWVQGALH